MMYRRTERRVRRSRDPEVSVQYYLESARLRLGLKGLVLADRQGRLVAGTAEGVSPELAAQAGPRVFDRDEDFPAEEPDTYFVEMLPSANGSLFLVALGEVSPETLKKSGTITGIRRILNM